jgi:hypothetical protein
MGELKIRSLTIRDRDWLSDLIKKLVAELGSKDILKLMVSDNEAEPEKKEGGDGAEQVSEKDKKYALLVIEIIKLMIDVIGGDVREWFASLIEKTVEEFKDLPIDTELVIIEQLVAVEESNRFFSRALALSSKIKGFANGLKGRSPQ